MLFVMLVVGVGPTVGMHFCGKQLKSVEVVVKTNETGCCKTDANNVKNHDDCPALHKDCCETHKVQMITDQYQVQERASIIPFFTAFESDWFTTNFTSLLVELDNTFQLREYFPPNGYDAKDANVLSFICILRI